MSMADYAVENKEEGTVASSNMTKQLAVAVRSVQWSYAIFWSLSTTQHGVLEWRDGYYNGDIKKRKNGEALELKAHEFGLQRSKQLRQLYMSMLEAEIYQSKTALSPDDLSDEEWYYLVCMTYVFNQGQGLPGRSFANDETIWVCNAQSAENKLFTRSLLARSASVQTVVCFPYQGGVIELGVTELIAEDHNLLQHIKACLLDFSKPDCHGKYPSTIHNHEDDDEKNEMGSKIIQQEEDSMVEDFSNIFQELQEGTHTRLGSMDLGSDEDLHYKRIVSTVLKRNRIEETPNLDCAGCSSSFASWKKGEMENFHHPSQLGQNLLRKILYTVPSMHYAYTDTKREKEKFCVLRSMVPSIKEIDKASFLNDTIKYLKELEARVKELESCMGSVDFDGRSSKNHSEIIEETSDNYDYAKLDTSKNQWINKRKESDIVGEIKRDASGESDDILASDVKVKIRNHAVLIEIKCPHREYIVADVMDAVSSLHMDAYSVRSSTLDGFLALHLKAKFRGAAAAPAGMIKRELRKISGGV